MATNSKLNTGKALLTFTSTTSIDVPVKEVIDQLTIDIAANIKYRLDGHTDWITCEGNEFVESQHLNLVLLDEHNKVMITQNLPGSLIYAHEPMNKTIGRQTTTTEKCPCATCSFLHNKYNELENVDEASKFDNDIVIKQVTTTQPEIIDVDNVTIKQEPMVHWNEDTMIVDTDNTVIVKQEEQPKIRWQDRLDGLNKSIKDWCTCEKCQPITDNSKSWANRIHQLKQHKRDFRAAMRIENVKLRRSVRIAEKLAKSE